MTNEISKERMKEIMEDLQNEDLAFSQETLHTITQDEHNALIETIVLTDNAKLAARLLWRLHESNSDTEDTKKFTLTDTKYLKDVVIKTKNADIACKAILDLSVDFTEEEKNKLRVTAVITKNGYLAYHLYKEDSSFLNKHEEARLTLRDTIVCTEDPAQAFFLLQRQRNNTTLYTDDWKSLELTESELVQLKDVIIDSHDPEWSYRLLITKKSKERNDERANYRREHYLEAWDDPCAVIELTPNERSILKHSIIKSHDPYWAYYAFIEVDDLSEGERMVLKAIIMQTEDIDLACSLLCNTDFIPHINTAERSYLKKLAVQVKDKYSVEQALTYIYDLTQEEKDNLNKILDANSN